jgi:hypothetical protein
MELMSEQALVFDGAMNTGIVDKGFQLQLLCQPNSLLIPNVFEAVECSVDGMW